MDRCVNAIIRAHSSEPPGPGQFTFAIRRTGPGTAIEWPSSRDLRSFLDLELARRPQTIYIDRSMVTRASKPIRRRSFLRQGRKRVLVVLFVPSVERDGRTSVNQRRWVQAALNMFGCVFGGATAFPKARGIWRDDERAGALVEDRPVVVHCYTTPSDIESARNLAELGRFCRKLGREARQGEVGLVIGDEYFAIRNFAEV